MTEPGSKNVVLFFLNKIWKFKFKDVKFLDKID